MTARKLNRDDDNHLFDEVIRLNAEVLVANGIDPEKAKDLAEQLCSRFGEEYGGFNLYVPRGRFWRLEERYRHIFEEYNGRNMRDLVRKYDLSERSILRIVSEFGRRKFLERQGRIFPES